MILRGIAVVTCLLVFAGPSFAFDPADTFRKGAFAVSIEGGFGDQTNIERHRETTSIEFWNTGIRFSLLPFGISLDGTPFKGALEVGLEPIYQHYTNPQDAHYIGLAAAVRYHFLTLGRFVPYVDLMGAAGSTDLRTREIRSDFAFLLQGGAGLSLFVTDHTAFYGGYRFQHVSNGNTEQPNRGFEAHTGVFGVSVFFP